MVELSNRSSRVKLAQTYHLRGLPWSTSFETLVQVEETYLEDRGNKFIYKVYGVPGTYRACNIGKGS